MQAKIDKVFLVVVSKDFKKEDVDKINARLATVKKNLLKQLNEAPTAAPEKEKADTSFTAKLVTSIINNIQVGQTRAL